MTCWKNLEMDVKSVLARQCDRCGKYMADNVRQQQEYIMLQNRGTMFDLCMDCYTELVTWIKASAQSTSPKVQSDDNGSPPGQPSERSEGRQ